MAPKRTHLVIAATALLLLTATLQVREIRRAVIDRAAAPVAVGSPAPELAARDRNGRIVRLADLGDRFVLVSFWASWCAPCRAELPELARFAREWNRTPDRRRDLVLVAVNIREDPASVRRFLDDERYREVEFLFDPDAEISDRWQVRSLPTSYVIAPDGSVLESMSGYSDGMTRRVRMVLARAPAP